MYWWVSYSAFLIIRHACIFLMYFKNISKYQIIYWLSYQWMNCLLITNFQIQYMYCFIQLTLILSSVRNPDVHSFIHSYLRCWDKWQLTVNAYKLIKVLISVIFYQSADWLNHLFSSEKSYFGAMWCYFLAFLCYRLLSAVWGLLEFWQDTASLSWKLLKVSARLALWSKM